MSAGFLGSAAGARTSGDEDETGVIAAGDTDMMGDDMDAAAVEAKAVFRLWCEGEGLTYVSGTGLAPAAVASPSSPLLLSLLRNFFRQDGALRNLPPSPCGKKKKKNLFKLFQ